MSLPDCLLFIPADRMPPQIDGFPHRLALLPVGTTIANLGGPDRHASAIFLVEPDCARDALNDPAFDGYLQHKVAVLVYARRAGDLRPFLKRADAFRRGGYAGEVVL